MIKKKKIIKNILIFINLYNFLVALSFTRCAKDIEYCKDLLGP